MNNFFITGTGTNVGKTWVTASLIRHLRKENQSALGLKPICCGERTDVEILAKANDETLSLNEINPIMIPVPLAPYASSVLEERIYEMDPFWRCWQDLRNNHPGPFLIEGAGGWLVPITRHYWVRDFARELGLPVVVVAHASLGTLNHTLLTVESIRASKLEVAGIFLNYHNCPDDLATQTNAPILEELAACPVTKIESGEEISYTPKWMK
jgi:dethiobiotin synthetase